MEIRRDPVTQSWVVVGARETSSSDTCPFERPAIDKRQTILSIPSEGSWQVRVLPHPDPLYRIEGEPGRLPDGMYDRMGSMGAHEIVVETPDHNKRLSQLSDEEIDRVLSVWVTRIADLKKDIRLKYVSVFKNQGELAGEEWTHAHSEITGTIFVPRRIKYELRAAREWFKEKERCVFCDIVRQEEKLGKRIVDVQGDYYALCPYSSRVPYEVWLLHRRHNHLFEQPRPGANRRQLAALLGRVLRRLEQVAPAFHLVVHTAPNTLNKKGEMAGYWKTHADAILVLSDDNFYADRATRAAQVYREGWAPMVVASGRRLRPYAGVAELMEHDLVERGVPKDKVMRVVHDAENTKDEAEALAKVAEQRKWKSVILVTSNYHTRRARYIFER